MHLCRRTFLTLPWLIGACRESTEVVRAQPNVDAPTASESSTLRPSTRDVAYLPGSTHDKHRLDIYAPAVGPAPFVHFVHGGYWISGDKNGGGHGAGLYASLGRALAARGIGCVVQSYRLAPEVGIQEMVSDVASAVAWSTANLAQFGGDPKRVFMMGHSAGGHLVALLAADPARRPAGVRGTIAISAIWDVGDMAANNSAEFNSKVTYPVFGRNDHEAVSPMHFLSAQTPPLLIAHGERDFRYLIPQAKRAHDRLHAKGHRARLVEVAGNDHMAMVRNFGSERDNMTPLVASFVSS